MYYAAQKIVSHSMKSVGVRVEHPCIQVVRLS